MKRSGLSAALVTLGLTLLGTIGVAHALTTIRFDLVPASAAVAKCLPNATGDVTVLSVKVSAGLFLRWTFAAKATPTTATRASTTTSTVKSLALYIGNP